MGLLMQAMPWLLIGVGIIGLVLAVGILQEQVDQKEDWQEE